MTNVEATALAIAYGIDLSADFHALPASTVCRVLEAADSVKYRKPKNANGSRGRYFFARLKRAANQEA